ncbi:hypothetical protein HYY75_00240 [bacterium]|nr:hypothetical protein [bacterium]
MLRMVKMAFLIFAVFVCDPSSADLLHPFYEQNGDCYLLIGDGPQRGVYALNNLTGGSAVKLYDPLDAYGISAAQTWDGSTSQKRTYTFAGTDTGWTPVTGNVSRRVIVSPDATGVYGRTPTDPSGAPNVIIHRAHNLPGGSPTTKGNHTATDYMNSLNNIFGGTCYPCSNIPSPSGPPGYYDVPVGKWYHSLDFPVWSPYTYLGYGSNPGGGAGWYNGRFYYMGGSYVQAGGWVHYVIRENVQAKWRNLKLYKFNVNALTGPTVEANVANVKTQEQSSMDKRGECVDGCITAVDNVPMPGAETPMLDCIYSSLGISYLYQREPSKTAYTLIGTTVDSTVIGSGSTANLIGASAKNNLGDYVYVLGQGYVQNWLNMANSGMTIASLTDVAVSDQWWQTGGIVYAYDKTQAMVYKFVRNETATGAAFPQQIPINISGVVPDSIGTDGFGNLYFVRTEKDPLTSAFVPSIAYTYNYAGWGNIYTAKFRQGVYKSVFKRDYYTGVYSQVPGRVLLGTNEFIRDFSSDTPSNRTTWVWWGALTQVGADVLTNYRTELAVINNATPPRPSGGSGTTDINNFPYSSTLTGFVKATPPYRDTNVYFFQVENAPLFDANQVNIGSTGIDKDDPPDGRIGAFPSTVKQASMKYYWKVIQRKDRFGEPVTVPPILDQEGSNNPSSSSILAVNLGGGEYKIGVKVKFKYYNYAILPLGALSNMKETVLSSEIDSFGEPGENGYAWASMTVETIATTTYPGGNGIIMSGQPSGPFSYNYRPMNPPDPLTLECSITNPNPVQRKFVLKNYASNWSFKLRESNFNTNTGVDRIATIYLPTPPTPADPKMVPGTLKWQSDAKWTWTSELKRGTEGLIDKSVIGTDILTTDQVKTLFPIPSQPQAYSLRVSGGRVYEYDTFIPVPTVMPDGSIVTVFTPFKQVIPILIGGQCEVEVADTTGPQLSFMNPYSTNTSSQAVFFKSIGPSFSEGEFMLYGTTGETLANVESPPSGYSVPSSLEIIVADNNPFGNQEGAAYFDSDPFFPASEWASHDPNQRYAEFSYQTVGLGQISTASSGLTSCPTDGEGNIDVTKWYRSDPLQTLGPLANYKVVQKNLAQADFPTYSWLPALAYHKCFSYRWYKIDLGNLKHFSTNRANLKTGEMDFAWANNSPGYSNLKFGFGWGESCNLATNPYLIGQILVRDNDRPNVFIRANELKNTASIYYCPSNILTSLIDSGNTWKFLSGSPEANHNGIGNWAGNDIQGFDASFRPIGLPPISDDLTSNNNSKIEIDIPVFFKVLGSDNTTGYATSAFRLASGATTLADSTFSGSDIRYIFRAPGSYTITLNVQDFKA